MDNLNSAPVLNPETEQLIHQVVSALLKPAQKGECRCHWIDPTKTPILVWKSTKDPNTLVMKINQQKLIGLARSDKNNELYWKFRDFYEGGGVSEAPVKPTPSTPEPPKEPKVDLPPPVQPEPSLEETEQIKKFREKYGSASEPKEHL